MAYSNLVNWSAFHGRIAAFELDPAEFALMTLVGLPLLGFYTLAHFVGSGRVAQLDHKLVALGQKVVNDGAVAEAAVQPDHYSTLVLGFQGQHPEGGFKHYFEILQ